MMQKQIFEQNDAHVETLDDEFTPKKEFDLSNAKVEVDNTEAPEAEWFAENFTQIAHPKPRWWKKCLGLTALLFGGATIAQSVQWLVDTWQQHQWIYFAFALVGFVVVMLGVAAIVKEWRQLAKLKRRMQLQQQSGRLMLESAVDFSSDLQTAEQGEKLCLEIAQNMKLDAQSITMQQWKRQLNDSYSAQEVAHLFSQTVLKPLDVQAKKLIAKSALESAVIVSVSPLAVVDMFFMAWRNIRLINRLARLYGIELGYISRLRLLRMVFLNMVFAGATEVVQDIGMDWLSQDVTAKLSARIAQGIGVGLLTARLGIKAMEFCRPLVLSKEEKLRLSTIQKDLLSQLKTTVLGGEKIKEKTKV